MRAKRLRRGYVGALPAHRELLCRGDQLREDGRKYASEEGALIALSYAREKNVPMLGTCGGFQYTIIELARSLLGIAGAEHAETHPDGADLVVAPLSCSLVGQEQPSSYR
jgi:CTP synthase (UTP-ammonia lyase)